MWCLVLSHLILSYLIFFVLSCLVLFHFILFYLNSLCLLQDGAYCVQCTLLKCTNHSLWILKQHNYWLQHYFISLCYSNIHYFIILVCALLVDLMWVATCTYKHKVFLIYLLLFHLKAHTPDDVMTLIYRMYILRCISMTGYPGRSFFLCVRQ